MGLTRFCNSFEVISNDSSANSAETIKIDRIAPAVAAVGVSFGLYAFPSLRPQPASAVRSRSRPRSGLLSAALDVFGGGGGLRRGNSMTSRGSSAATTSIMTPNLSASMSPRTSSPFISSLSPRPASTPAVIAEPTKRPITKKSAPDLYRRASYTSEEQKDGSAVGEDENRADDFDQGDFAVTMYPKTRDSRSLALWPQRTPSIGLPVARARFPCHLQLTPDSGRRHRLQSVTRLLELTRLSHRMSRHLSRPIRLATLTRPWTRHSNQIGRKLSRSTLPRRPRWPTDLRLLARPVDE